MKRARFAEPVSYQGHLISDLTKLYAKILYKRYSAKQSVTLELFNPILATESI